MNGLAILAALFVCSWLGIGLAALLNAATYEPTPFEEWDDAGMERLMAELDKDKPIVNGFVWVVMPEEYGIDPEPYVFTDEIAAERFKRQHGGWVSEEPILDNSFNEESVT